MTTLSLSTFRARWPLFLGAIVCVAFGVALVQSSLRVLASAFDPALPTGLTAWQQAELRGAYDDTATIMAMTTLLAGFLTVFVIGSTFAFTISQRRRELALLRLLGANTRQMRGLLLAEALLLGLCGALLGTLAGPLLTGVQTRLLDALGFLPPGYTPAPAFWALPVAAGAGVAVALLGVLAASRRAARVRPLEALRREDPVAGVMSTSRWVFGLSFGVLSLVLLVLAGTSGLPAALALSVGLAMTGALTLVLLSPLVVPLVGRLVGGVLRADTLGGLAEANLRTGIRRSAATAAPLIVLVALVLGLFGTLSSLAEAAGVEGTQSVSADLIVTSTGAQADRIAAVPGVATASPEFALPVLLTKDVIDVDSDEPEEDTQYSGVYAVDPLAYRATHPTPVQSGSLADLRGSTVAVTALAEQRIDIGARVVADLDGRRFDLRVAAVLPERLTAPDTVLVPRALVPADVLAGAETQTAVRVAPNTEPAVVAEAIRAADLGSVSSVRDWARERSARQQDLNVRTMVVLIGLSGLYALIAVVNAVVVAGTDRRREFAVLRVTGLGRGQVVRMALVEAWAVTVIGLLLGGLVAAGALAGVGAGISGAVGQVVVVVPWALAAVLAAGAFAVVGATSVLTALSTTRAAPVELVTARE